MNEPSGCPMPERAAPRMPRVEAVPWLQTVTVVFLARTYHRWMIHYDPTLPPHGADVPCKTPLPCPYCPPTQNPIPGRLVGWVPALGRNGPKAMIGRFLLAMPYKLCLLVDKLLDRQEGLAGLEVTLKRGDSKRNDSVDIIDCVDIGTPPLPAFDVEMCLEHVWKRPGFFAAYRRALDEQRRLGTRETLDAYRGRPGSMLPNERTAG
jgi:hypothetical protein